MQDDPFQGQKPDIEYPTTWGYRVIGVSGPALRTLIAELLAEVAHEIHAVQPSKAGTYVSVRLTVTVRDEAHRNDVYQRLTAADAVKMVRLPTG